MDVSDTVKVVRKYEATRKEISVITVAFLLSKGELTSETFKNANTKISVILSADEVLWYTQTNLPSGYIYSHTEHLEYRELSKFANSTEGRLAVKQARLFGKDIYV